MPVISTINGQDLESGHTYRVNFIGNKPRHDGAIWEFTHAGRASKDAAGVLIPSAHGKLVWHGNANIVEKFKTEDPYLSAKFNGTITEVSMDRCVGSENGAAPCTNEWGFDAQGARTRVAALVIRDLPTTGDARCYYCQSKQTVWEQKQQTEARQSSIEEGLAAAIAKRNQASDTPAPVVAGPVIVKARTEITEAGEEHPLAHLIPDMIHYDLYVSRYVNGVKDIEILDSLAARGLNWLTEGPTESGKTMLITAWCALRRRPLVTIPCNGGIDATSIFSTKTLVDGDVQVVLSNATKVLQYGGVLNLDEINFAPQKVTAVLHEALDDRRQVSLADLGYATFKVHPQAFIVASYNGGSSYTGTVELNAATKRRFKQLPWGYDEQVERKLIARLPVLHTIKAEIRKMISVGDVETPLGPSKLLQFEEDAMEWNVDLAISFFLGSFEEQERDALAEVILHHRDRLDQEVTAALAAAAAE